MMYTIGEVIDNIKENQIAISIKSGDFGTKVKVKDNRILIKYPSSKKYVYEFLFLKTNKEERNWIIIEDEEGE